MGNREDRGNGIMNTHGEADGRLDTMLSCALSAEPRTELLRKIQRSNTTDEAMDPT